LSEPGERKKMTGLSSAIQISGLYLLLATAWILCSDYVLSLLATEVDTAVELGKLKGLAFVVVTSAGLFFLVRSTFSALERARRLAVEQKKLLEMVATNHDLDTILDSLVALVESQSPGIRCSVLRIEEGTLRHAAAPSLPVEYREAVDGLPIGPNVGACGTAAHTNRKIYSNDIATDPDWTAVRELALSHGLRACWSTPIRDSRGREVLGTFAIYSSIAGPPSSHQETLFDLATYLGTIAFEQERARSALIAANQRLEGEVSQRTRDLRRALARAKEADRVKSAFLATMSHELRTPLNSIIGFTGLLRQEIPGPLNDEQKKQLDMVRDSSRHLLELINDVLDISKIEAGQLQTTRERFSVRETLQSIHGTLRPSAEKKGLTFEYRPGSEVQEMVSDERRVRQIVINLVNNAIKFTQHGEIVLSAEADDRQGQRRLTIQVRDTGVGIDESYRSEIFKSFSQVDTGLTRFHEGTGLGLAICKRLCALLGGSILLESSVGSGSTFTVVLPLEIEVVEKGDAA
jgi:signal transduction histidine kinase